MNTATKITDADRADAQEAMQAVYGTDKGYTVSDHDVEMMLEFLAIRKDRLNKERNQCMKEATEKHGVEW